MKSNSTHSNQRFALIGASFWVSRGEPHWWLWAAETLGAVFNFLKPVSSGGFGGILRAGTVAEFAPGSINQVKAGRFYLRRFDDGSFMAFWQRCIHIWGAVCPGVEEEKRFVLPVPRFIV